MSIAAQQSRLLLQRHKLVAQKLRFSPIVRSSRRLQSTSATSGSSSSALIGGVAGGGVVLGLGYTYYHYSGAKSAVNTVSDAKSYIEQTTKQLKAGDLKPEESLQWLRSTVSQYVALIPGGRQYADSVFKSADKLVDQHGEEFSKIISNAQKELKDVAGDGSINLESAKKVWDVLAKYLGQIQELANDATQSFLKENPEIKAKFGEQIQKLQEIQQKGGKQAQSAVDEVWSKLEQITKSGSISSDKIGKIIQEGVQRAQQLGDDTWNGLLEKAKPYIDKDPELKRQLQQAYDKFNGSDASQLSDKLQDAARTGNLDDLKSFTQSKMKDLQDVSDNAWRGAKARLGIYLDKHPELQKLVDENTDIFKNVDVEEFLEKLREARDSGNIQPVKDYIQQELRKSK